MSKQVKDGEQSRLEKMGENRIKSLTVEQLRQLARDNRLPTEGTRDEIALRLVALKRGGDKRYIHGKTLCRYCREIVDVRSMHVVDGTIVRHIRCRGRRRHRYQITEPASKPAA